MIDFFSAICLILVIEGSLYALFPNAMRDILATAISQPSSRLRSAGMVAAIIGFAILWLIRG